MDAHVEGGRWQRADVAWRNVGSEVVIARPGRCDFDVLQGPTAELWRTLEGPTSVTQIASVLSARYDADLPTIAADLSGAMADLRVRGLVQEAAR